MPFTLSHAAAALPFRRFKPIWPALVMGTFAPDVPYFIWISDEDRSGHHFPMVLLGTIPLALVLVWLFERIVKGPVVELLPLGVQRRLQNKLEPLAFRGWRQLLTILLWIAVGVFTHLIWDYFTHPQIHLIGLLGFLNKKVPVPWLHPMPLTGILQNVSTVLGLVALCVWGGFWYARTTPVPPAQVRQQSPLKKCSLVATMIFVALLVGYSYAAFTLAARGGPLSNSYRAATVFEAVTTLLAVELLLYGLLQNLLARRSRMNPADKIDSAALIQR